MLDVNTLGEELIHYWSKCVAAGRANEGLRASWRSQLITTVKECGFRYIRFHGLLHDDMCVYRIINGEEVYNFQYIDDLFDFLIDIGIRPIVELSFMPADMASKITDKPLFWWNANMNPPADYDKWYELIYKLVQHFSERYSQSEVKKWYFEVWNEPNLHDGFWSSGKSEYFKLYEYTVKAVKAVNNDYKVGGPATSNFVPDDRFVTDCEKEHVIINIDEVNDADWQPVWINDFIKFCHEKKLPVDFISTHPYPTDVALDGHGTPIGISRKSTATTDDLKTIRKIVDESPYPNAEILLTEWSTHPSSRDFSHDYPAAAAYVFKANIESRGLVDALAYWDFTDIFEEMGGGNMPFHGGFGMINFQSIKKPVYHAYRFLNELGNIELYSGNNYIVTKNTKTNKTVVAAYNYDSDTLTTSTPKAETFQKAEDIMAEGKISTLTLELCGFNKNTKFSVETVNYNSGCAMKMYKQLCYPSSISHEEIKLLQREADSIKTDIISADKGGVLLVNLQMQPWEILLIKEL